MEEGADLNPLKEKSKSNNLLLFVLPYIIRMDRLEELKCLIIFLLGMRQKNGAYQNVGCNHG